MSQLVAAITNEQLANYALTAAAAAPVPYEQLHSEPQEPMEAVAVERDLAAAEGFDAAVDVRGVQGVEAGQAEVVVVEPEVENGGVEARGPANMGGVERGAAGPPNAGAGAQSVEGGLESGEAKAMEESLVGAAMEE